MGSALNTSIWHYTARILGPHFIISSHFGSSCAHSLPEILLLPKNAFAGQMATSAEEIPSVLGQFVGHVPQTALDIIRCSLEPYMGVRGCLRRAGYLKTMTDQAKMADTMMLSEPGYLAAIYAATPVGVYIACRSVGSSLSIQQ